jgi:glycerol-3-phosphate dehydrogenase (NAD(P)+)
MKIGYLGAGTWGFCLAALLASKGHKVILWTAKPEFAKLLSEKREHPKLLRFKASDNLSFTSDLSEAIEDAKYIVESVTSKGIRPVFEQVLERGKVRCPVIVTSKGIEQNTGLLLHEVILEVLGEKMRDKIACLSGPSHAEEVIQKLPTSIVCAAYHVPLMHQVVDLFMTSYFRIYPNSDINGVAFGGSMKNIIAIACGISDGLGFGDNTKSALMTRGLHEIRKLSVTCLSKLSRNYMFGRLIADGLTREKAQEKISMVVEGAYTCISALQLAAKENIPVPITAAICSILYEQLDPRDAVKALLQRAIKEEHL